MVYCIVSILMNMFLTLSFKWSGTKLQGKTFLYVYDKSWKDGTAPGCAWVFHNNSLTWLTFWRLEERKEGSLESVMYTHHIQTTSQGLLLGCMTWHNTKTYMLIIEGERKSRGSAERRAANGCSSSRATDTIV